MEYREIKSENHDIPMPSYVSFNENIMYLVEKRVAEVEATALKQYLIRSGNVAQKRIRKLVIDQCSVSDESLSLILEGIYG